MADGVDVLQESLESIVGLRITHIQQLRQVVDRERAAFFAVDDFQHTKPLLLRLAKEQLFEFDTKPSLRIASSVN